MFGALQRHIRTDLCVFKMQLVNFFFQTAHHSTQTIDRWDVVGSTQLFWSVVIFDQVLHEGRQCGPLPATG